MCIGCEGKKPGCEKVLVYPRVSFCFINVTLDGLALLNAFAQKMIVAVR